MAPPKLQVNVDLMDKNTINEINFNNCKVVPCAAAIAVWPISFLINMLTVLKGSQFFFFCYLLLLQLVLCRMAALKSLPVHHT